MATPEETLEAVGDGAFAVGSRYATKQFEIACRA